jgi:hypothetical protein
MVQCWVARFESGNTSCEDISRARRPLTDLAAPFGLFLQNYPFASVRMLSQQFRVCATTVKEILVRDLGLKKFARRWVSHTLSDNGGKVQKHSIGKASYAVLIHPIRLI